MKNKNLADNTIYLNSPDNKYRYAFGIKGKNTLYCIGINPSTATPSRCPIIEFKLWEINNSKHYNKVGEP